MSDFQEDYVYRCPYCSSEISVYVDLTAGRTQAFTVDCEICCRPISISVTVDESGVTSFEAEKES